MAHKEYVITLKDHADLDKFYEDMETKGGPRNVPNRAIPCAKRRPVSRSTHYMLDESEAGRIKNDPRVLAVELSLSEIGAQILPTWTQTSSLWNKSNTVSSSHKNWGLIRCVNGVSSSELLPPWGSNGTTNISGTINTTSSGKNVDVVIVDGSFEPKHPEFAQNADGTGQSRVIQYNWFALNSLVNGSQNGIYDYAPYVSENASATADNDHGAHVAGIACGNTCGWARDATIYSINPYSTAASPTNDFLDYIKVWHATKPINPLTGKRNPTITNHSYGVYIVIPITQMLLVSFRGVQYSAPFTESQLESYGINVTNNNAYIPIRSAAIENDLIDLINLGVIVVGAAGNEYTKISESNDIDYNNFFITQAGGAYYQRGSITAAGNVICVGSISTLINESKSDFSNPGPRVDVYAPGNFIMSSVNSTNGVNVGDSRNTVYRLTKKSGTSMASPQVAGILACLAEQWPRMSQADALEYITTVAKDDQIYDTETNLLDDYLSLQGGDNKFLYYRKERVLNGQVTPSSKLGKRQSTGMVYPRSKIYRYGI